VFEQFENDDDDDDVTAADVGADGGKTNLYEN
jgi:hypothetical protein